MFDKFGEFNSAEEINRAVAAQLKEGDYEAIFGIAEENGIDKEEAQDYIDGCMDGLVTPLMAAVCKVELEAKVLKVNGILTDWKGIILQMCSDDVEFCKAVRRKGKALKYCMAALIKFAFENKVQVSDEIVNVTKVIHNGKEEQMRKPLYLGIPNNAEAKKIIRDYYMG